MSKAHIPLRPKVIPGGLTQAEMSALTWYVISGCTRYDAFVTFARPDMLESKAKASIDSYVRQFFARKEVKDYLEAYEKTLEDFIHPPKVVTQTEDSRSIEERKSEALTKLVEYVLSQVDEIDMAEDPKAILEYANKIGVFDVNEKAEEVPRRYLPEQCGPCAYRAFCEQECDDLCQFCRAKKVAEENGFVYEKQTLLELGTEFDREE